jgi:hypothetical protein
MTWQIALISGVFGLLAGVVGSLIAPWINWGIEKQRLKLQHRRDLVAQWRKLLHSVSEFHVLQNTEERYTDFVALVTRHEFFESLQPHLSSKAIDLIQGTRGEFWGADGVDEAFKALSSDVDRIRREWRLD